MKLFNRKSNKKTLPCILYSLVLTGIIWSSCGTVAYARGRADGLMKVLTGAIDGICMVLQAAGIIIAVYSVGNLILSFKNEDADSKTRSTTQLTVAVIIIALPTIVRGLHLMSYFTK